jgi:hypothetical protein
MQLMKLREKITLISIDNQTGGAMKQIFIVQGSTGEYSDHKDWLYKAYYSRDAAIKVAQELNAKLLELCIHRQNESLINYYSTRMEKIKTLHEIDPKFCLDHTGSDYTVLPCDIADEEQGER